MFPQAANNKPEYGFSLTDVFCERTESSILSLYAKIPEKITITNLRVRGNPYFGIIFSVTEKVGFLNRLLLK